MTELLWTSFKERRNKWGKLIDVPDIKAYKNTQRSRRIVWRWEIGHKEWHTTLRNKYAVSEKRRRRDLRIRTSLDRWSSDVWHDLIYKRWLIIGINRISDNWNPKSLSHYPRGNGELNTSYPTPNNGVRIIDVTWEVREELSNQSGRGGWSISKRDNQPLDSRLALMARSTSSRITECSA